MRKLILAVAAVALLVPAAATARGGRRVRARESPFLHASYVSDPINSSQASRTPYSRGDRAPVKAAHSACSHRAEAPRPEGRGAVRDPRRLHARGVRARAIATSSTSSDANAAVAFE
jgi:hypothetical protein